MSKPGNTFVLTIVCPDTIGIVAAVSGFLSSQNYFIDESNHFGDPDTNRPGDRPNENYAREILELHTLGDGNCYDQGTIHIFQ